MDKLKVDSAVLSNTLACNQNKNIADTELIGWALEFENEWIPDEDDITMRLMALEKAPTDNVARQKSSFMRNCLVCFAVDNEAGPFRLLAKDFSHVQILVTGMGSENAQKSISLALNTIKPDLVITSGFAGGLDPELMPETNVYFAPTDFPLTRRFIKAGAQAATIASVPKVICFSNEKHALWKKTGIQVTDMESDAIHQVCQSFHVPCATLRVISDAANEDLPLDFNQVMDQNHQISIPRLFLALIKYPHSLPRLIRFHRRIQSAAKKLGCCLHSILSNQDSD